MNEQEQDKKYYTLILGIDYDEFDENSYKAATVSDGTRFETGDPVKDFEDASRYAWENAAQVMCSSSVGHFVWDVPGYRITIRGDLVKDE